MIKYTLPNGVRLLTEAIDHVRSASVGLWFETGSRHEPLALAGVTHFIEHMLF
ncbi:MAG: insulinase family protein, partial [Candidatus Sumerlaeota bacterium]|nr:insulinase family protein [Candidatus Sumerlaeota bacterium]